MINKHLIHKLLRKDGLIVSMVECYFDESGTHDGATVMCLAGYIIEKEGAVKMTDEWQAVLDKYDIAYFHMVDCAHGNGIFKDLSRDDRIAMATSMIELIKKYAKLGLGVSMKESDFQATVSYHTVVGSSYSFGANAVLAGVQRWLEENAGITKAAFVFEAGHDSQTEAQIIMGAILSNPTKKKAYRDPVYQFVKKTQCALIQAADILAWHIYTDKRHEAEGKSRRKDYISLLEIPHKITDLNREYLERIAEAFRKIPGFEEHGRV